MNNNCFWLCGLRVQCDQPQIEFSCSYREPLMRLPVQLFDSAIASGRSFSHPRCVLIELALVWPPLLGNLPFISQRWAIASLLGVASVSQRCLELVARKMSRNPVNAIPFSLLITTGCNVPNVAHSCATTMLSVFGLMMLAVSAEGLRAPVSRFIANKQRPNDWMIIKTRLIDQLAHWLNWLNLYWYWICRSLSLFGSDESKHNRFIHGTLDCSELWAVRSSIAGSPLLRIPLLRRTPCVSSCFALIMFSIVLHVAYAVPQSPENM